MTSGTSSGTISTGSSPAWRTRTNPTGYPLDFLTFGRSGTAHLFRIYDEKIHAMGPVPALAALAAAGAKTLS